MFSLTLSFSLLYKDWTRARVGFSSSASRHSSSRSVAMAALALLLLALAVVGRAGKFELTPDLVTFFYDVIMFFFQAYLLSSSYSCRLFFCSRASIVTSFFRSKHGNHFHPVSFCFLKFSSAVSREEYICCEFVFMIFLLFDRFVVLGLKHEKVSPFVQSFLVFQFPYCVLLLVMVQPDVDLCNLKHLYLTLIPVFLSLPNYDTEWKIFALLLH